MDLVIGLDSGTTATKAVAVAADATVIATSSVGYPLLVPHPGYAELDSVGLQKAAVEAVAEVATQVRQRGDRVVALCLSAAMHGLAPLDDAGAPTGPLITWADSRAAQESRSLAESSHGQLHKRTGTPVHPMSPLPKLLWWRTHHLDAFAGTSKWGGVRKWCCAGCARTGIWSTCHVPQPPACTTSRPVSGIRRRCSLPVFILNNWPPSYRQLMS